MWKKEFAQNKLQHQANLAEYHSALQGREKARDVFFIRQQEQNNSIDKLREAYGAGTVDGISSYCELVLTRSNYPSEFPQDIEVIYQSDTKLLLVNYQLPSPDLTPEIKEARYIIARNEFQEIPLADSTRLKLYDSILYQITLRSLHEIFQADSINAIKSIVFNGFVQSIDRATGNEVNACILSVMASKEDFLKINLASVDPKACFKKLKGIGSSELHSLTPVPPIAQLNREDKRFIASYDVAGTLDEGFNLAAMDWDDFEHLVREIFAKEFSESGGEVKVTRASRDHGVDAVAFDPDPIRGGKIVIQAKRYANTVGVSAVRDLYGTVLNEGATKGILVSTSDYGPDVYEFARDKPLTLLNGGNLLHLLDKHGHKAHINLVTAKKILGERET